jgi:hypothetical protein
MSCRTARLSAWITSLRGAQVGDFQVATGGGIWVATGVSWESSSLYLSGRPCIVRRSAGLPRLEVRFSNRARAWLDMNGSPVKVGMRMSESSGPTPFAIRNFTHKRAFLSQIYT